jgi:hypothetical protein
LTTRRNILGAALGIAAVAGAYFWLSPRVERRRLLEERRAAINAIPRIQTEGLITSMGLKGFLKFWDEEIIRRLQSARFPLDKTQQQIIERHSIFLAPASAPQLAALEARLGMTMPPTLRSFLSLSNGAMPIIDSTEAAFDLFPIERMGWLHEQDPELVEIWNRDPVWVPDAVYNRYGPTQDVVHIRRAYLKRMVTLSPVVDGGVFLLNPQVRFKDRELEVWDFSVKYPGAKRYPSFASLLEAHCQDSCWNLEYWSLVHGWTPGRM